ncbi:MAG: DinB family protein [Pyrinomonadaceae bacterium]
MLSNEYITHLFQYNDWANRRILVAVKTAECKLCIQLFSHLLVTEREYYARLFGKDSTGFDFMQILTIEELRSYTLENASLFENLLKGFDDEGLGQITMFRTSEGIEVSHSFREIFTQVILHSMNHRGQIITQLRRVGFEPPKLDYIFYCRELPNCGR